MCFEQSSVGCKGASEVVQGNLIGSDDALFELYQETRPLGPHARERVIEVAQRRISSRHLFLVPLAAVAGATTVTDCI